jgi:predicted DNA binding CopG/RHH family protein
MPWIRGFVWDDENVAHIARHGVTPDEAEEVLVGDALVLRGPDNRYLAVEGEAPLSAEAKGTKMKTQRRRKIPAFRSDRDAAHYWARHDSAAYAKDLPRVVVKASPALRRRVAARAKKPVTLRLEEGQILAAKQVAERMSVPYQTLLRMWIGERLAKERAG